MLENPDFEQSYLSETAEGIYRIGHDSVRLTKWTSSCDRSDFKNIHYYDLMGSVRKYLNEIS